jgi:ABC-type protease/lipase transport system fused ATPase/permease subunit
LPIPVSFRAETVQQVVRLLRSGESCALVGVGSSGKSNIARHLARPDIARPRWWPT